MLFRRVCGIDLGSDTIKICDKNKKIQLCEKNMIAIRNKVNVIAIGQKAYEIYEKAPNNVVAERPMVRGAIADVKNLEIILSRFLKKFSSIFCKYPDLILTIPMGISELEKRVYQQLLTGSIKAKRIALIENGLADAIGIGMPVLHAMGNMVVNIGAASTEITVVSDGKVVIGSRLEIAGDSLDEEICNMVRKTFDVQIGRKTAEILKNNLAYALNSIPQQMKAYGIHSVTGLPAFAVVHSEEVSRAMEPILRQITDAVKFLLERIPPQLASDIKTNGIYLTGGVAQIPNLSCFMQEILETPVFPVPEPIYSTTRGLVSIMNEKEFQKLTFSLKDLT